MFDVTSEAFELLVRNNAQARVEWRDEPYRHVAIDGRPVLSVATARHERGVLVSWIMNDVSCIQAGYSGRPMERLEMVNGSGTTPWLHEWFEDTLWVCYRETDEDENYAVRFRPSGPAFTASSVKLGTTVDVTADRRIGVCEWNHAQVRVFSLREFAFVGVLDRAAAKEQGLNPHDVEPDDVPRRSF